MNRIRELRKQKGFTQLQFCQKMNITQSTLSGWETGRWQPDNEALIKLADFFGVTIDYLLERTDEIAEPSKSGKLQVLLARKKDLHLTYDDLSNMTGLSRKTIVNFFLNSTEPRKDTVEAIEQALNIKNNLVIQDEVELNDNYMIPLLGSVVAGVPIEAQQDLEGYIYISHRPAEEYFALRVHGDSMKNVGIMDKCVLVCHKQEIAENGEIVVAMLNGEQTVKRYKIHGNNIFLMPENPDYLPIPVTMTDELLILGKVVEIRVLL